MGSQDPRAGSAPGPSFQWNGRGDGGGKERKLGYKRRRPSYGSFLSRGFLARGSPPEWGHRASGLFDADREAVRGPGGLQGREAGPSPRPLKALSMRLPPPTTRWRRGQRGSPAREVGGKRGEERRGRNKKTAPPRTTRPARGPGSPERRAGRGATENAARGGHGLTFSCRSRRRRPPWRIGPRDAFTAGGPQARSGLSAGSLHTRGEKERHVQRCEAGNPS